MKEIEHVFVWACVGIWSGIVLIAALNVLDLVNL